jgi:hypothetical protein
MKKWDRLFCCLMILAGVAHTLGALHEYKNQPPTLMWALAASFARFLLAALNFVRTYRPTDQTLAWFTFSGNIVWTGFVVWMGLILQNFLDIRVAFNLLTMSGLILFSLATVLHFASYREMNLPRESTEISAF